MVKWIVGVGIVVAIWIYFAYELANFATHAISKLPY